MLMEEVSSGASQVTVRMPFEKFARTAGLDPLGAYRERTAALARAKMTMGICGQLLENHVARDGEGKAIPRSLDVPYCHAFEADLNRLLNIRFPDGSRISAGMSPADAREKLLRFATGNEAATWKEADRAARVKTLVLMAMMNQNANGVAEDSFFETLAGGGNEKFSLPVLSVDTRESRSELYELSKDANGDITVRLRFRVKLSAIARDYSVSPDLLADGSYREFEMVARLPAANLDALSRADWTSEELHFAEAKAVDSNPAKPDSIAAEKKIGEPYRFTGSIEVAAHLHLVKA